jgi:hypothetical protein
MFTIRSLALEPFTFLTSVMHEQVQVQLPTGDGDINTRLFDCLYKDPDPGSNELRFRGLHQLRPISRNPFAVPDSQIKLSADYSTTVLASRNHDEKVGSSYRLPLLDVLSHDESLTLQF